MTARPVTAPDGARLEITFVREGRSNHEYTVRLIEGEWPNDDTLIDLCDRHAYGGSVIDGPSDDTQRVTVYVD